MSDAPVQYIWIVRWRDFQHYKPNRDRGPAWIKTHTAQLHDERYLRLTNRQRGLLHDLRMVFATTRGRLPLDAPMIARARHCHTRDDDLAALNHAGLIEFVSRATLDQRLRHLYRSSIPEKELEKEQKKNPPNPPDREQPKERKPRAPDVIWDALVGELRTQPSTTSERGRWNRAVSELREAGATPEEIKLRSRAYRKRWPDVSFTVSALAANWGSLQSKRVDAVVCSECGVGGNQHAADCPVVAEFTEAEVENLAAEMAKHR